MNLVLSSIMKDCQDIVDPYTQRVRKRFASAWIISPVGAGKTSYGLNVTAGVFAESTPTINDWKKAFAATFLSVDEIFNYMGKAIEHRQRIPILVLDDAGFWLHKLTWWKAEKVAFMSFFQFVRTVCSAIIFTSPVDELPKPMRKMINYRVLIQPLDWESAKEKLERGKANIDEVVEKLKEEGRNPYLWNLAKGYRLNVLPSFFQRIKRSFYDLYPNDIPAIIYDEYEERRLPTVEDAFKEWKKELRGKTEEIKGKLAESSTP